MARVSAKVFLTWPKLWRLWLLTRCLIFMVTFRVNHSVKGEHRELLADLERFPHTKHVVLIFVQIYGDWLRKILISHYCWVKNEPVAWEAKTKLVVTIRIMSCLHLSVLFGLCFFSHFVILWRWDPKFFNWGYKRRFSLIWASRVNYHMVERVWPCLLVLFLS